MRLALDGDQLAYRSLLAAIAPHVRMHARRILARGGRGRLEVEDIVQEALLAVYLKRASHPISREATIACSEKIGEPE